MLFYLNLFLKFLEFLKFLINLNLFFLKIIS